MISRRLDRIRQEAARRCTAYRLAALTLPTFVLLLEDRGAAWPVLIVVASIALLWEDIFATARRDVLSIDGLVAALILALLAPPEAALWQLALALSLGLVLGSLVFGGAGFGFMSTAAVSLAFLSVSFPGLAPAEPSAAVLLAALPGAGLLLWSGLSSWRVALATCTGFGAVAFVFGGLDPRLTGPLLFGIVFLACDPFGSPVTNPGRWVFGALLGGLAAVLSTPVLPQPDLTAFVFAVVLANIFGPLIDQAVIASDLARRRWSGG